MHWYDQNNLWIRHYFFKVDPVLEIMKTLKQVIPNNRQQSGLNTTFFIKSEIHKQQK